jgi:AAA domain-containing protein/phospholipase D-like protein
MTGEYQEADDFQVKARKLKEWEYSCADQLRQEAHLALQQEYSAAVAFAKSEKLTLEEGLLIKKFGDAYCYRFSVSQLTLQSVQVDRPHRLEINKRHVEGSIISGGDGLIVVELSSDYGKILHRIDVIFDVSVLLDLVDRRLVDIDREPSKWNTSIPATLFTALELKTGSPLICHCDHLNRFDGKPLKEDQQNVVNHVLQHPFSLIWGPPGTGKTHTLLAVLAEFLASGKKILFASNTNTAIDNVLEKIIGKECPYTQLKEERDNGFIVRLGAQTSDAVKNVFSPQSIALQKSDEINEQLTNLNKRIPELNKKSEIISKLKSIWKKAQQQIKKYNDLKSSISRQPQLSQIEKKLIYYERGLQAYRTVKAQIAPVVKNLNDKATFHIQKLNEIDAECKAASSLIQSKRNEKAQTDIKLNEFDTKIQQIIKSRIKRFLKSKELEILKAEREKVELNSNQLRSQIGAAEKSLEKATGFEIAEITRIHAIITGIESHRKKFEDFLATAASISTSFKPESKNTSLLNCISKLIEFADSSSKKETLTILRDIIQNGWVATDRKYSLELFVANRIDKLTKAKNQNVALTTQLASLKEVFESAKLFINKHLSNHSKWDEKKDKLTEEISEIKQNVSELEKKLQELENFIIKEAKLVCLTMVKASYDRRFLEQRFDALVIDEFSMVSLPQLYCTAAIIKERVVLCGDHLQLPPICQSKEEIALKWMGQSFFAWHEGGFQERQKRIPPGPQKLAPYIARLTDQRRMPPEVSYLIRPWYKNEGNDLNDDWITKSDDYIKNKSKHLLLKHNVCILDTSNTNCYSSKSAAGGRYNIVHAAIAAYLCKEFYENHDVDPKKIITLTPYRLQSILTKTLLYQICPEIAPDKAETTCTIHKSQGRGGSVVIYDLTDGKENALSWFHRNQEPNLLNVAVSRTEARLILICSLKKMAQALNAQTGNPLRSVFKQMAAINVPVFDAKPYYDIVFKRIDTAQIFSNTTVSLTDVQKNGILVLTSKEYYESLSYDLKNAKKSITFVSPFITQNRMDSIEPLLVEALHRSGSKLLIEIITRPPERMFDRNKDNHIKGASVRRILNRLHNMGIKITIAINTHEKLVVIDDRISYWGSLNPLSFRDTDEINTRLEAEGLAHKLLEFAVHGRSEPYKLKEHEFTEGELNQGIVEIAKKDLQDLAWTLAGYYGRPRMALMYNKTIDSLTTNPPTNWDEFLSIPEISGTRSLLRKHLGEIENIIYPIRGYKLELKDDVVESRPPSQLNLFELHTDKSNLGKDIINTENCECYTIYKVWAIGERPDPKLLTIKDFSKNIIEVLEKKHGNACKKDILSKEVLKHLKINTHGRPKQRLISKIEEVIKSMIRQGKIEEFTTTRGNKRIKIVNQTK